MEAGYLGSGHNTWLPSGGGGGGGGSGNMLMFSGVCGQPGGPVAGGTTWAPAAAAGSASVLLIVVNKAPEQSIGASPDFTWNGTTINRAPNVWVAGDTIVGWYIVP